MVDPRAFLDTLCDLGIRHFTGVPCSILGPIYDEIGRRENLKNVVASSEGDAVAIATGLWLGGNLTAVLCQNSGLGNMINPLASLAHPFKVPFLLIVTLRGLPGAQDEPQHAMMGRITAQLLDLLEIPHILVPRQTDAALAAIGTATRMLALNERPCALLVEKNTFACATRASDATPSASTEHVKYPRRDEALKAIISQLSSDCAVVATTGHTSRDLFSIEDRPNNFYCVGAMGYANSIAHGLSLATERPVVVIDGDGAALMHLGNLGSIGNSCPKQLTHIILDNQTYASTGGQPTASTCVDFQSVGFALGYRQSLSCQGIRDLLYHLSRPFIGPRMLHLRIADLHMKDLPRPTLTPDVMARRFKAFFASPVPE